MSQTTPGYEIHDIDNYLTQIETASSADAAWDVLSDFASQHALTGICCKCFPSELEADKRIFFSSTKEFDSKLASLIMVVSSIDDPLLLQTLRSTRPFRWSDLYAGGAKSEAQILWTESLGNGNDAIVVPVFGPLIRHGYFCFVGSKQDIQNHLGRNLIHVLAQVTYLRMCELFFNSNPDAIGLSQREREVMRSVANGQSNTEIAQNIGISDRTVETYLNRIYDKLGVRDRVRASLRAYTLGLLA